MAMSLMASCARGQVQTLADLQRDFNALFGTSVAYKPFHNQLAKRQFADFMRELTCKLIERRTVQVLKAQPGGAFSEFGRILIQDSSSFAVHNALSKHYPGRFQPRSPAAVELHVTMDLYRDCASKITLTADTAPEEMSETIAAVGSGHAPFQPRQRCLLIDEHAMRTEDLPSGNVVWAQIELEHGSTEAMEPALRELDGLLAGLRYASLRRGFAEWARRMVERRSFAAAASGPAGALEALEEAGDLGAMASLLAERWDEYLKAKVVGVLPHKTG